MELEIMENWLKYRKRVNSDLRVIKTPQIWNNSFDNTSVRSPSRAPIAHLQLVLSGSRRKKGEEEA